MWWWGVGGPTYFSVTLNLIFDWVGQLGWGSDLQNLPYTLEYLAGTFSQNLKTHWKLQAHLENDCLSSRHKIRFWWPMTAKQEPLICVDQSQGLKSARTADRQTAARVGDIMKAFCTSYSGLKKLRHGRGNMRSVSASYVPIYTQNLYLIFVGL